VLRGQGRLATAALALTLAGAVALISRGVTAAPVPTRGARIVDTTIDSGFAGARLPLTLITPAGGGAGRPLLVFLHGRGGDQDSELSAQMFAALAKLGSAAPDLAFPDGGDHSYWHDRTGGRWGTYVLREVIPIALRTLHADTHRLAIGGVSMGGFGAYDLARLAPGRFCAVGGHAAALWTAAGDSAPGAFDDAADFARHNIIAWVAVHPRPFGTTALWLDGGNADPFHAADETFARELGIRMHVWPGGHAFSYWNAHWADYLGFYARSLASCRH
jgi:S-formylglutathione hydrolase FrmB